jgi:tripartite-type tricarboxylate transporter receptor subunit TctC
MKKSLNKAKNSHFGLMAFLFTVSMVAWPFSGASAAEKKFPSRPIQVVIGFQPGDTDNLLRPFIEKMPEYLGEPLTFVYKAGAAGSLGASFVAAAKPDGYTLLGTSQSSICVVPLIQKNLDYNWESFSPVSCLLKVPYLLAVKADTRWKNIRDLVAEAKKEPNKITYSSSGTFGLPHIAGEIFCKEAAIRMNYIPSQGSTPAVTAVLGGHVDAVSTPTTPVLAHIRAGTMRALAVFGEERMKALPDVPTFREEGYPVVVSVAVGLLAPPKVPRDIIETLHQAAAKAVKNHGDFITDRMNKVGSEIFLLGPEEYSAFLRKNYELFRGVLKDMSK